MNVSPNSADIERNIASNIPWSELPKSLRNGMNNDPEEYEKQVVLYSFRNQLRFGGSLVQQLIKGEKKYYENLIDYNQQECLLYPYHLQDKIVPGLRVTPFIYYRDLLISLIRNGKSYDSLPNFTAVDCLRLLGVGRNQYIEIMNTYRSFLTTAGPDTSDDLYQILYDILPQAPLAKMTFEPWYIIRIGAVLLDDIENSTSAERILIDKIIDSERYPHTRGYRGLLVQHVDLCILQQLHRRGLIYIEVPVCETDRIRVSTLDGFVMNRVSGDSRENLLYKIFVSANENTTITELSEDLQMDLSLVQQAASIFIRLGIACKRDTNSIPAVSNGLSTYEGNGKQFNIAKPQDSVANLSSSNQKVSGKKLAFVFDSAVTAYLMMGNLSTGLKPHAVTMFEVGKLSEDSLESFLVELDNLSSIDEGEAKTYYEHAINLREAIHFLRAQALLDTTDFYGVDLLRGASLLSLESATRSRILQKNYNLIISLSPLTHEDRQASSSTWPPHIGPPIPEANSPWFNLFVVHKAHSPPPETDADNCTCSQSVLPAMLLTRGFRLTRLPEAFDAYSRFLVTAWGHDPVVVGAHALLPTLNDLTLCTPVLVQAAGIYINGVRLYRRFIPLPLPQHMFSDLNSSSLPTFLKHLSTAVDLCSLCGFLTVLAPCLSDDGSSNASSSSADYFPDLETNYTVPNQTQHYLEHDLPPDSSQCVITDDELCKLTTLGRPLHLINLYLGLPIFNTVLLRAIFSRTSTGLQNSFTSAGVVKLSEANHSMVAQLTKFIRLQCGAQWPRVNGNVMDSVSGPWPLPTRSVLCSLGRLETLYQS